MQINERPAAKSVDYSVVREWIYKIFPNDLNQYGTVFGGLIMAQMDRIALAVAERHSLNVCVTVGVDTVQFLQPAVSDDTLVFHASVNKAWETSMEIGLRVEAYRIGQTNRRHILSAYMTFVAINSEGARVPVPQVIPETYEEKRRYAEADLRRASRLRHAEALKQLRRQQSELHGALSHAPAA
jgi:acyl-CoA hydrolase